jgi:hypothetical protein
MSWKSYSFFRLHPSSFLALLAQLPEGAEGGGTVALASSDPAAALPDRYTFTARDAGKHAFKVTLSTAGLRSITATHMANGSLTGGEANISVGTMSAAVAGPAVGARGQPLTFTLTAAETNQPAGTPFTFKID